MKKILLLFGLLVVTTTGLYAQVGIGTTDPLDSAQLEVVAKDKGVLIPRLALTRTGEFKPVEGTKTNSLLVYNTGTNTKTAGEEVYPGYYYWYEGAWNRVVSKGDFSNPNITKTILNNSNIVTYDSASKTLNYYSTGGTTSTVSVIDVINNSPATQSISVEKIKAGAVSTVLASVMSGTEIVTQWKPINSLTTTAHNLTGGSDIYFVDNGGVTSTTITDAVLTPFTIKLGDVDISKLTVSGTTANKGDVLIVGDNNSITYTSTISADKIQKSDLVGEAGSGITVDDGEGIILGNKSATIKISELPVSKLGVNKVTDKNKVLVTDATTGEPKWGKLSPDNINGGDLVAEGGISVDNGVGALLKTTTISITNVDISKVTVSDTSYDDKLLMVKNRKLVATNQLPVSTTVSITNIVTATPTAATSTQVVTIDGNGVATVTTIEKLLSDTIKVGNGLTKDGKTIKLGGKLTDPKTTITTNSKTTLAIEGLTHTGTIEDTDKVVVLGDDNVMHTVSATSFKGSGDYTTVTNTTDPSKIKDQPTGNTFTDKDGNKKKEYIRTAYVTSDGSTKLKSKLLNVGATGVIITDVKITGADADNAGSLLSSVYEYKAASASSEATIGLGVPGSSLVSTRFTDGQKWYVIIKYVK